MEQPRRKGRPTKEPKAGQRVSLGLKVTAEMKRRIDAAARESGRTQSQEAELRLEHSFRDEGMLAEVLELAYGREVAGLLMAIGLAMPRAGRHAAFSGQRTLEAAERWFDDPYGYHEALTAAATVLLGARPEGNVTPPTTGNPEIDAVLASLGQAAGQGVLLALQGRSGSRPDDERAARIRALLGDMAERLRWPDGTVHVRAEPGGSIGAVVTTIDPGPLRDNLTKKDQDNG